ncbi:hypothetical protein BN1723_019382, partial [Verticillium longisporum]
CREACDPAR